MSKSQCTVYDTIEVPAHIMPLFKRRDRFGQAKYGTRLCTNNGRCFISDSIEESLDLYVYLRGAELEGHETEELQSMVLEVLEQLLVMKAVDSFKTFGQPAPT